MPIYPPYFGREIPLVTAKLFTCNCFILKQKYLTSQLSNVFVNLICNIHSPVKLFNYIACKPVYNKLGHIFKHFQINHETIFQYCPFLILTYSQIKVSVEKIHLKKDAI